MTIRLNTEGLKLRPYTITELAHLYGVSNRTMKRWMQPFEDEMGKRRGRFYSINQVRVIFDKLSLPATIELS